MRKIAFAAIAVLVTMFAVSCERDLRNAPTGVQATFESMFPNAVNVEWEKELDLYKAEFVSGDHEKEAWFEKDGSWKRTKTEILRSEVPEAVISAATSNKDASWVIDDIDFIEQATGEKEYYLVEFDKKNSERENTLRIRPDGTIITK